jgi:Tol biopolymer transport system component
MPLESGHRLGNYEIQGLLGVGGMGEVYRAKDLRLDREVAIKVLPDRFADDPGALTRFEREAKAVAALAHPNIVAIYDFGIEGGHAYAAMELLEGETLRERLEQSAFAPWKSAMTAHQVACALGAAHDRGIVHRDLKPENIFLGRDGQAKVLDFGLAAGTDTLKSDEADSPTRTSLTEPGTVMGTVGYMSPEQVRGETADHRSDIFSFGCVLHEMLCGRRAFHAETGAETMTAILREHPAEVDTTTGSVSPGLARIVRRCLEKSPDERFQSARDLAFAIDNAANVSGARHTVPKTGETKTSKRRRFGTAALAIALAAGLITGLVIATALRDSGGVEPVQVRTLTVSGRDSQPAASPDGEMVAFMSTRDGTARIWIKQLAGGGEEPLTSGPDSYPAFSPDGSMILFLREEGNVVSVYRQGLVGGQPRKIVESADAAVWSPNGTQIAFLRAKTEDGRRVSYVGIADVQQGGERIVREFASGLQGLAWSPDGATLAVVEAAVTGNTPDYRLLMIDVDSGEFERETVIDGSPLTIPSFTASGELVLALSKSLLGDQGDSLSRFIRYDPASGEWTTLFWAEHLFPLSGMRAAFSRSDIVRPRTLVYDQITVRQNLREVAIERALEAGAGRVLTRGEGRNRQPVYSPDGRHVVFSSSRAGNLDLWAVDLETGEQRQLTDDATQDWDPGFTVDGEQIVWSSDRTGHLEIWIANADLSNARQLTDDGVDAENPTVTADGEWVLYWSANPDKQGVWKIRPDGRDATQLVSGPVLFAEVSPDGRCAAFVTVEVERLENTIQVVDVATGAISPFAIQFPTSVRGDNILLGRPRWLPGGKVLAFVGIDERDRTGIFAQDFDPDRDTTATRRPLAGFLPDVTTESFGISPDGRRITLAVMERTERLMLAEAVSGIDRPR